jgi:hypothetical protein
MNMILNNGQIIYAAPLVSEKTRKQLEKFWRFPKKEDVTKQKEKYYEHDYQRDWQANSLSKKKIESQSIV